MYRALVVSCLTVLAALGVSCTPAAAQSGATSDPARYVSARRPRAKDELKSIQKQLARARDYYRDNPVLDAYGRFLTPGEVSLLQYAESELTEELSRLDQLDALRRRPVGGDPRANQRQWADDARNMNNRTPTYEREQKSMRARLPDATRARREDAAYGLLMATLTRQRETMDVWLAAVGGPSLAAAAVEQEKVLALTKAAERERQEALLRRRAEGDAAWREFGNLIGGFVKSVVAEDLNVSTTDLGEGGEEARRLGVFSPNGLRHGDLLQQVVDGDSGARTDYRLGSLVGAWVVKFSAMCPSALPSDRVEITTTSVNTLVERNGLGAELSRQTFTGRPEGTGIFATPAFGKAYVNRGSVNPVGELAAFAENPTAMLSMPIELRGDARRVIARHGCTGPVTRRFADSLLALVQ